MRSREQQLDEQVDEILKKIHESGEESLTEPERLALKRASERYQRRSGTR